MSEPIAVPNEVLTRRLRLRRPRADEIGALQGIMKDADLHRLSDFGAAQQIVGIGTTLLGDIGLADDPSLAASMTITLPGTDQYLGGCSLAWTADAGVMEIYFTLTPAAQGYGYATEAVDALIGIARSNGANRIVARVLESNRACLGVLERAGFTLVNVIEGDLGTTSLFSLKLKSL